MKERSGGMVSSYAPRHRTRCLLVSPGVRVRACAIAVEGIVPECPCHQVKTTTGTSVPDEGLQES